MNPFLTELLKVKAHLGKSQWNREISEFLVGFRGGISVFDLEKTSVALSKVLHFLKKTPRSHILVATRLPGFTHTPRFSCVKDKWVGGMLTNWKQISQSILIYSQFQEKYGEFLNKHNIRFPVYQKYLKRFSGMNPQLPGLLIVTHPKEYEIAVLEAHALKIPVIAFIDTDTDPALLKYVDYIIPGRSPEFILFCLNMFATALE